jgi:hypothetical protein
MASPKAGSPADVRPELTTGTQPQADTPTEAVLREALKLMDDLAGVRTAMAMLAAEGQAPAAGAPPRRPAAGAPDQRPSPASSYEQPPLSGGAPSGAAGSAPSGGGSAALYALVIALAALAGGLWARLQVIPVRWRSVTIVALNERPG